MRRGLEAVVQMAALDLRRHPDHRSELRSQLLLGETVEIVRRSRDGVWVKVRNRADAYGGWVRSWGILESPAREAAAWRAAARWRVAAHVAYARARPGRGPVISPLFWNSPVAIRGRSGPHRGLVLPGGRHGWIEASSIRPKRAGSGSLRRLVEGLLGTPYLWGGRTPLGFDCSGFVQQLLAARGVEMPRDAHEQFRACRPVSRAAARPGDLLFFGRPGGRVSHVGILLGAGVYAHARGTVRINSLESNNHMYDNDLSRQLRSVGRPPRTPSRGAHSC